MKLLTYSLHVTKRVVPTLRTRVLIPLLLIRNLRKTKIVRHEFSALVVYQDGRMVKAAGSVIARQTTRDRKGIHLQLDGRRDRNRQCHRHS